MTNTKIVKHSIQCEECENTFVLAYMPVEDKPLYCPFCGEMLEDDSEDEE